MEKETKNLISGTIIVLIFQGVKLPFCIIKK